mmetsp:Transcript_8217/g.14632  ORF Transcript_8217/g.14632 Transcript_8217/m.14632 type:complete len:283 (-) Transcript_8217:955-1803(-)
MIQLKDQLNHFLRPTISYKLGLIQYHKPTLPIWVLLQIVDNCFISKVRVPEHLSRNIVTKGGHKQLSHRRWTRQDSAILQHHIINISVNILHRVHMIYREEAFTVEHYWMVGCQLHCCSDWVQRTFVAKLDHGFNLGVSSLRQNHGTFAQVLDWYLGPTLTKHQRVACETSTRIVVVARHGDWGSCSLVIILARLLVICSYLDRGLWWWELHENIFHPLLFRSKHGGFECLHSTVLKVDAHLALIRRQNRTKIVPAPGVKVLAVTSLVDLPKRIVRIGQAVQ